MPTEVISKPTAKALLAGLCAAALSGCSSSPWAPEEAYVADACQVHISDLGYKHGLLGETPLSPTDVDALCADASPDPEYIARAYLTAFEAGAFVRESNVEAELGPNGALEKPRHWSGPSVAPAPEALTLAERESAGAVTPLAEDVVAEIERRRQSGLK